MDNATNGKYQVPKLLLRIERAKTHFRELDADIKRYLEAEPYEIVLDENAESKLYTWRVKEHQHSPIMWEIIVGDVLHNLRAALDHLACELVMSNGGKVTRNTAFPFSESADAFAKHGIAHVAGASERMKALLGEVKPYDGGNHVLYRLHKLNIQDKHGLILGASLGLDKIEFPDWGTEAARHIAVSSGRDMFWQPLADGTHIISFRSDDSISPTVMREPPKVEFEVVFWEPKIVKNKTVRGVLTEIISETETTVRLFLPYFT